VKIETLKLLSFFVGANLKILCKLTIKIPTISPIICFFFIDVWEKVAKSKIVPSYVQQFRIPEWQN
jgi:hypothetical protein